MGKRRRSRHGVALERARLSLPSAPNQVRSMDFVLDALNTGRRIKCLTVLDDFTKETVGTLRPAALAAFALPRHWMKWPDSVITTNNSHRRGPECTDKALDQWA